MEVNVAQLLKSTIGTTRDYEIDEFIDIDDNTYAVQGDVRLIRTHRGILAKAELKAELELTCSRCLASFKSPVSINFEEEYVPAIDVTSGVTLPPPEDSSMFIINEHHILDLAEAVRQHILLAIPMKPLCRQDCAGLCPKCGQNLNNGTCNCPGQVINPRWAELSKLL